MKLYYFETLNPRKACAVAQYLRVPVEFARIDLGRGEHKTPEFLALNPNGKVPVLRDGDLALWESNAIMCYLSDAAKADLWPHDARQIEVLRWLNWDACHFTRHAGTLYFEHIIKPRLGLGEPALANVKEAMGFFRTHASVLNDHLRGRKFLLGDQLTVADFAVGITLPYAGAAKLPINEFPEVERWHERLAEMPAWRDPFPVVRAAA
ncbi:MAG: glutathione S-transferase family protein [Methylobacteriaceae bacterium]|nr:glutathione S-transferase family protein [Methylobacteriaceae bacterium]MBV9246612.1 glutathione S-transferase family protein [Methylobacteriaceae bacterium]